ncbi:MAG: DHHW family protein [Lachnospiraceae bacterium]
MKKNKENKRKQSNIKQITALVFLGILLILCLTNLIAGSKKMKKPEATVSHILNGQYAEEYEKYMDDRFAGKRFFEKINHSVETLLGKRESNGVFQGKKHHLAEKIETPDQESMGLNIEAIKEFDTTYYNIPVYFMLVPDAANIQSDMLPSSAVTENQSLQFEEIKKMVGEELIWVDAESALKEHKDEKIYYCTDEHWTTLGAYYGYEALAKTMGLDLSQAPKMKSYVVNNDFNGSLSEKSGYEKGYQESISIYSAKNTKDNTRLLMTNGDTSEKSATLYDSSKLEKKNKYELFLGGNSGLLDIETTVDSTKRLLIIKDSYANCLVPFLVSHFREIVVIDPDYYKGNLKDVMQNKKFTEVLFLYSGNSFVTNENIRNILD